MGKGGGVVQGDSEVHREIGVARLSPDYITSDIIALEPSIHFLVGTLILTV